MSNSIRFILDGEIVEIDFNREKHLSPTTTVLKYLRSLRQHKGVKEGCGEGDCGACTVVIAERGGQGNLVYRAIDSCLVFLPMIHGKQLITVENLAVKKEGKTILHPVQQAIIDTYGTQCGYCTPGIVMSLFALYKNHREPSKEIITEHLSGNLCRCTGYRSIIEAAEIACAHQGTDHFNEMEGPILSLITNVSSTSRPLKIVMPSQIYLKPFSISAALRLRKHHPSALVLSGGTDIALRVTKKHEHLGEILDISEVRELKKIRMKKEYIEIGAAVALEELRRAIRQDHPALYSILSVFGSMQIRNLATLGGNIGSASPIGDTLPLLMVLNAKIRLRSISGSRELFLEEFISGYRQTDLRSDELITSIILPKLKADCLVHSCKVSKRKELDISTVSAAMQLKLSNGNVSKIILAFGGMAATTRRAKETEKFLMEKPWTRETVQQAMELLRNEFTPISDARSGENFRRIVCSNILMKFYLESIQ